jgi:excisionase family DNA binding protein
MIAGPDPMDTQQEDTERATQRPQIRVHILTGVLGVWIPARGTEEMAALLHRANAQRVHRGEMPLPMATETANALRYAANLSAMVSDVPHAEHELAEGNPSTARLVTTGQAAQVLGITERAVRQRIARKKLSAKRVGRDWHISTTELGATA